jgi:hypothetical protein
MTMEHKAFVFDTKAFDLEVRPVLERALSDGDTRGLVDFIRGNVDVLKDPYEGEPLNENWENSLQVRDPHQYGDFALTKYYDPRQDIGLGRDWEEVQSLLLAEIGTDLPILGRPIGPPNSLFDPGKMGSYFQSEADVRDHLAKYRVSGSWDP